MTSISKSLHIDKLDCIVNKYNNAYHRTIKFMTFPIIFIIKVNIYAYILTLIKKRIRNVLNLKLVIM